MKIVISCGGTGGHFFPGLAIAKEFQKAKHNVVIVLSGKNCNKFAKICAHNKIESIIQNEFSRKFGLKGAISTAFNVLKDIHASYKILKIIKPDAVLAMGSFASSGICMAAHLQRIALFLHEGNAVVGKNNRIFSRWARRLYLSFPIENSRGVKCGCEFSGFPLRAELNNQLCEDKSQAKKKLNFDPNLPLVLVFGGSQGATSMNSSVTSIMCSSQNKFSFQLCHIAGNVDEKKRLEELYKNAKIPVTVLDFVSNMDAYYQATDLAIVRAGAATIYECAAFALPIMAVPLPWAADNHQLANAKSVNSLAKGEAIRIITQSQLDWTLFSSFYNAIIEEKSFSGALLHETIDGKDSSAFIMKNIIEHLSV